MEPEQVDHTKRDAETFLIIGGFVLLLAIPVGLGHFWEWHSRHAQIVNLFATAALFVVGAGMVWRGFALLKRVKR
ncbi:MAG: hypothetical protein HUU46_15040 [Candidatus Hydrogenedentes bacterium]|nr:hypothetical protein [Candidatus Hydrogenedentota bacterium]